MMTSKTITVLEKYLGLILCAWFTFYKKLANLFVSEIDQTTKKIVFVKFIEQGALILHQAAFKEAAAKYGSENIFLCTFSSNQQLADVIQLVPDGNRIYINDTSMADFALSYIMAISKIRKTGIDTVIDLEFFSRASAVFCYLTGAARRVGYHRFKGLQNYRGDLFTHRVNYSHYVHVAESSWSLLKSLDVPVQNLPALDIALHQSVTEPSFTPLAGDLVRLDSLLGVNANEKMFLLVINLSLNDLLPLRKWPKEHFGRLIVALKEEFPSAVFVFTGRADEFNLTQQFIDTLVLKGAINLCGKTQIRDILTLYSKSKLLITSDSGPAHFASLTTVHTLVMFGPETPALYAPLSARTHVFYQGLPCSPCYNVYNNRLSSCTNNICMQRITVESVLDKARQLLVEL
ncbi:MAG: glycosyltransferase family 9 protein [Chitinophagales bacterium]